MTIVLHDCTDGGINVTRLNIDIKRSFNDFVVLYHNDKLNTTKAFEFIFNMSFLKALWFLKLCCNRRLTLKELERKSPSVSVRAIWIPIWRSWCFFEIIYGKHMKNVLWSINWLAEKLNRVGKDGQNPNTFYF